VKKAVEAYWAGKLSSDDLAKVAADTKQASWTSVKSKNVDSIPRFMIKFTALLHMLKPVL
jgi:5-methyltetrahydropteroyltriglutamate--homocysteine methyltransferase